MGCPACTAPADLTDLTDLTADQATAHQHVEASTQFASPELIKAIVYEGLDAKHDPQWPTSGAVDVAEYGRWCGHCCGMACLQMILQHRDGTAPDLIPLLHGARRHGAYVEQDDGSIKGLIYAPFVDYIGADFGLTGQIHPQLPLDRLLEELSPIQADEPVGQWTGRLIMASVHREIRRPERPAPGRGGHLVLITGHDPAAGTVTFHNPSGHTPAARAATLTTAQFETFYAGRGVTVTLTLAYQAMLPLCSMKVPDGASAGRCAAATTTAAA